MSIDLDWIVYVLAPLVGGADDDEMVRELGDADADDPAFQERLIRESLEPCFSSLPPQLRSDGRRALAALIARPATDYRLDGLLLPFDAPRDPVGFYRRIWERLFPGESPAEALRQETTSRDPRGP